MNFGQQKAWKMGGQVLDVGTRVSVEELINGIAVQSGNDAAVVVAEGISGSEEAFADEMNSFARQLGMDDTNFTTQLAGQMKCLQLQLEIFRY